MSLFLNLPAKKCEDSRERLGRRMYSTVDHDCFGLGSATVAFLHKIGLPLLNGISAKKLFLPVRQL